MLEGGSIFKAVHQATDINRKRLRGFQLAQHVSGSDPRRHEADVDRLGDRRYVIRSVMEDEEEIGRNCTTPAPMASRVLADPLCLPRIDPRDDENGTSLDYACQPGAMNKDGAKWNGT